VLGIIVKATAVIAGIGTAAGVIYLWFGPSSTSIDFQGADDAAIHLVATNSGPRTSTIIEGYRLKFPPSLNFEDVSLSRGLPHNGNVVKAKDEKAENKLDIYLTIPELTVRERCSHACVSKDEVYERISKVQADAITLEVDVRESNDPISSHLWGLIKSRDHHTMSTTTTVGLLSTFIGGRMSDVPKHANPCG